MVPPRHPTPTNGTGSSIVRPWSYIRERWLEIPVDTDGNGDDDNTKWLPPTFRWWLSVAKTTDKRVFIEMKNGPNWSASEVREFVAEVKRQDMIDKAIIAGSEADLATAKAAGAKHLSWGIDPEDSWSVSKIRSVVGGGYVTFRLTAAESHRHYTQHLVDSGIKIFLWTLTKASHYERALPFGVYGWMCNNTDDAYQWLQTQP